MKFFIQSFSDVVINGNEYALVWFFDSKGNGCHSCYLTLEDALSIASKMFNAAKKDLHAIAIEAAQLASHSDEVKYYEWCEMRLASSAIAERLAR
jgi:hypothetical protein